MPERSDLNSDSTRVAAFAAELRALRTAAGLPSFRVMAGRAHFAPSTLAEATRGVRMPSRAVVEGFAQACGADPAEWAVRRKEFTTGQVTAPALPRQRPILPFAVLVIIAIAVGWWIRRPTG